MATAVSQDTQRALAQKVTDGANGELGRNDATKLVGSKKNTGADQPRPQAKTASVLDRIVEQALRMRVSLLVTRTKRIPEVKKTFVCARLNSILMEGGR